MVIPAKQSLIVQTFLRRTRKQRQIKRLQVAQLAITQLEAVERFPTYLSYGLLKLQPIWDPLRGDPQFEQIVTSLAPRE
jgi:hypothetical protein